MCNVVRLIFLILVTAMNWANPVYGQVNPDVMDPEDRVRTVGKELMTASTYATLITLDASGQPQARTMEVFSPTDDFTVWMGTNIRSAKVGEIQADERAAIHYEIPDGQGYVLLTGTAAVVDDEDMESTWWKAHWTAFYPDRSMYALIRFTPRRIEVVSYAHDLVGEAITWQAPSAPVGNPE